MQTPITTRSMVALLVGLVLSVTIVGCGSWRPRFGTTYGLIYVDQPEIIARERLIQDRRDQEIWLEEQLKLAGTAAMTVQGRSQTLMFSGLSAEVNVNAQGPVVDAYREAWASHFAQLQQNRTIAALESQKKELELRQQIEALKNGTAPAPSAPAASTTTGSTTAPAAGTTPAPNMPAGPSNPLPPPASGAFPADFQTAIANGASGLAGLLPAPGEFDFSDDFRERLAYRDEVRTQLLETRLDDRHDLAAHTLIRLKLDATVIPDDDSSAWAVVEVAIDRDRTVGTAQCDNKDARPVELDRLFDDWAAGFESDFRLRVDQLVKNPQDIPDESFGEATCGAHRAGECLTRAAELTVWNTLIAGTDLEKVVGSKFGGTLAATREKDPAALAFNALDRRRYLSALQIATPSLQPRFNKEQKDQRTSQLQRFCELLTKNERGFAYAYAVTPKESAQRLSEAAGDRELRQLSASLAFLTGSVGGNAGVKHVSDRIALINAVRRQPIVVGYSRDGGDVLDYDAKGRPLKDAKTAAEAATATFGWLIGPRLQADPRSGRPMFRHSPSQHGLSALVSVPTWWSQAQMCITTTWRTEAGKTIAVPNEAQKKSCSVIRIPFDPMAITNYLAPRFMRAPAASFAGDVPEPALQAGVPGRLLIVGDNLWRDPEVFVGSEPATRVRVLPGMRGLMAEFSKVPLPAGCRDPMCREPVMLWTAESEKPVIVGTARIFAQGTPASSTSLSIRPPPLIIDGQPFSIEMQSGSVPEAYSKWAMSVRPLGGAAQPAEYAVESIHDTRRSFTTTVRGLTGNPPEGGELEVGVVYLPTPQSSVQTIRAQTGKTVYYPTADKSKAVLAPVVLPKLPGEVSVTLPVGYEIAYPQFGADSAKLAVTVPGKDQIKLLATSKGRAGRVVRFELRPENTQTWEALTGPVTLAAVLSGSGEVPLQASTITVTAVK